MEEMIDQLPDRDQIRERFPGLAGNQVLLDNAGGSQVPRSVPDAIHRYMLETYVQLGADYARSVESSRIVAAAHELANTLMNAQGSGSVVIGPSTSQLSSMLASAYGRCPHSDRNHIIVAEAGHEAGIAPWLALADQGYEVSIWRCDPLTGESRLEDLDELLDERTRIVAMHHVSNLLGNIEDVKEITRRAHGVGAKVVVDGVAYAPHRAVDVSDQGVDWYLFSVYKVYGPHLGLLFGRSEGFAELEGPNFHFVDRDDIPYKFELGGVCHELAAGLGGIAEYLSFVAGTDAKEFTRRTVNDAFARMTALELPLQSGLLDWLKGREGIRIIGPATAEEGRVATVSFTHATRSSRDIVLAANERGIGIRYGHFYAHRLALAMGLTPEDGVVRTSMLHYNTEEEVDRLIECLEELT